MPGAMEAVTLAPDKQEHFAAGYAIAAVAEQSIDRSLPQASPALRRVTVLLPVVLAAVGKEIYDAQHPDRHQVEEADAAATIFGGACATFQLTLRW